MSFNYNLPNIFKPKIAEQQLFLEQQKTKIDAVVDNGIQKFQNFADKVSKPITNFFVPNLGKKQQELSNLKDKTGNLFLENNDLQVQKDNLLKKQETKLPLLNKINIQPKTPEKRKQVNVKMWGSDSNPIIRQVVPQYDRDLSLKEMKKATEARATVYDPKDKNQTNTTSNGVVNGVKLKWGDIASSRRDIPKGTKVYVKELNKTFIVRDRLNGAYSEVKGYNHFDFAAATGSKEEQLVRSLPTITFQIVD